MQTYYPLSSAEGGFLVGLRLPTRVRVALVVRFGGDAPSPSEVLVNGQPIGEDLVAERGSVLSVETEGRAYVVCEELS